MVSLKSDKSVVEGGVNRRDSVEVVETGPGDKRESRARSGPEAKKYILKQRWLVTQEGKSKRQTERAQTGR